MQANNINAMKENKSKRCRRLIRFCFIIICIFLLALLFSGLLNLWGLLGQCIYSFSVGNTINVCNFVWLDPVWLYNNLERIPTFIELLKLLIKPAIKNSFNAIYFTLIFALFCGWYYRKPYILIKASLYATDEPPTIWHSMTTPNAYWPIEWSNFVYFIPRICLYVMFYANIIALPSIRRLAALIFRPATFQEGFLSRDTVYKQAQLYIETTLLTSKKRMNEFIKINNKKGKKLSAADEKNIYTEIIWESYVNRSIRMSSEKEPPEFECDTCFDIFNKAEKIEKYFKAQQAADGNGCQPCFLSPLTFESGFLAPTYLVSGPLSEYDEDWTKIIDAYQSKIDYLENIERPKNVQHPDPLHHLPELRKLQSFIWDCWVQWGPSIPICASDKWSIGAVALQFGYGDENNSLPICYKENGKNSWHEFSQWRDYVTNIKTDIKNRINDEDVEQERHNKANQNNHASSKNIIPSESMPSIQTQLLNNGSNKEAGIAWPVKVKGHLYWLNQMERNKKLCTAQQKIDSDKNPGTNGGNDDDDEEDGMMIFVANEIKPKFGNKNERGLSNTEGLLFYSAYIWVLIALCKDNGNLYHPMDNDGHACTRNDGRWRGLIPFFQHGNIADASVYEAIKYELAVKTVDTMLHQLKKMQEIEKKLIEKGELTEKNKPGLRFAYVAAFDDNGDFTDNLAILPGESILVMMKKIWRQRADSEKFNIHLDKDHYSEDEKIRNNLEEVKKMTSSDIPEIVQAYLEQIK